MEESDSTAACSHLLRYSESSDPPTRQLLFVKEL